MTPAEKAADKRLNLRSLEKVKAARAFAVFT